MAKRKYRTRRTRSGARPSRRGRIRARNPMRRQAKAKRQVARRVPSYKYTPVKRRRRSNPSSFFARAEFKVAGAVLGGSVLAYRIDNAVATGREGMVYDKLRTMAADYKVKPSFILALSVLLVGYFKRTKPWAKYAIGAGVGLALPEVRQRLSTTSLISGDELTSESILVQRSTSAYGSSHDVAGRIAAYRAARAKGPSARVVPMVAGPSTKSGLEGAA